MEKSSGRAIKILNFKSQAMFHPNSWVEEGDGLFASARALRVLWLRKKIDIRRSRTTPNKIWPELIGYPKASVLLLGYSIEMYLKAGLAKWLQGCSELNYEKAIRHYGHDYCKLAKDLQIPESVAAEKFLTRLKEAVLMDGRYPAQAAVGQSPIDAINLRTSRNWSQKDFRDLRAMSSRLRAYVQLMNLDSENVAIHRVGKLDGEGYLVFRMGGNLPSRITFRPSEGKMTNIKLVEEMIKNIDDKIIKSYWKDCDIYIEESSGKIGFTKKA